jgi:anti-sigma B factor antagonist
MTDRSDRRAARSGTRAGQGRASVAVVTGGGSGEPAIEQLMNLSSVVVAGCNVLQVAGEVEALTVPRLVVALRALLDDRTRRPVVLDLSHVTFLASAGLRALTELTDEAEQHDRPLPIVVDETRPVIRPIQLSGLERRLVLFHTVEEAAAY